MESKPSDIIRDSNGKLSARKTMFLLWTFAVLTMWLWVSYVHNQLEEIPESIKWIFGILGGTYLGGNYLEKKNESTDKT